MALNKVYHIAEREFKIRVKKKSFWIMTFLGPAIMACLMIVPVWLSLDSNTSKTIVITDSASGLYESLPSINEVNYVLNTNTSLSTDSVLHWFNAQGEVRNVKNTYKYSTSVMDKNLELLLEKSIHLFQFTKGKHNFLLKTRYVKSKTKGQSIKEILSYMMSLSVYFFIFMYGVQVMKGVVEEKSNRIVEVMLCTVKPFELLMGKILGVSAVGLLQFVLWIVLVLGLQTWVSSTMQLDQVSNVDINTLSNVTNVEMIYEVQAYLNVISELNWGLIMVSFLFFFFIGFLLFASLFAVIGSASDVDTDTQQFIFPITIPLLGTVVLAQQIISQPFGSLARVLSIVPFTSPIAMPLRLPFENQSSTFGFEVLFSAGLLFMTFIFVVWIASRIYRIGILSYGSKVGYKQLVQWFFTKE